LHPKFDNQGVNKISNLTIEDWVMWLADVQVQLVSNLEEVQKRYKENDDEHQKEQPSFKVGTLPHIYHSKKNL
jgi:protein required for attachment to host cells